MNLFIIPSWYPSNSNPSYGIFIKEQVEMMAQMKPDWKLGVSLWGQGDERKLLWVKNPIANLRKVAAQSADTGWLESNQNISEYYTPALSWTKRFRKGNLNEIIRCNEVNFNSFIAAHDHCDLISVQASYPGIIIGSYLAKKNGLPLHLHIRLGGFMFERLLKDLGSISNDFMKAIRYADLVTVTSEFQRQSLTPWIQGAQVVHNPVDTAFFSPNRGEGEGIVAIGRLEEEKGFDMLIEAVPMDQNLNIIGDGAMRKKLMQLVQKTGKVNIRFHGECDRIKIRELLNAASFLVLPSRFETFGNVLLEAMACGRPVVATRCGGPEEIISSATGVLCEPSIEGLTNGINKMIVDSKNFDSATIRHEVVNRFGKEVWIKNLEAQFRSLV